MFAGVHLGQQQLEHRFVGRVDTLEQLPQAGADKFAGGDTGDMAEVEAVGLLDKALADQLVGVVGVARLLVHRHQPPQRETAAEQNGGAIKLVQQQVVLGGAAVLDAEGVLARALGEMGRVDQVEVGFAALGCCPVADRLTLAAQLVALGGRQIGCVADPDIQVTLFGLADGTATAHQVQPLNVRREACGMAAVLEAAGQALGHLQAGGFRFEIGQPAGRVAGNKAGQQGIVDVKQQRDQLQHVVLPGGQCLQNPAQARGVECHEALAQGIQSLAVNALFNAWLDFTVRLHVACQDAAVRRMVSRVWLCSAASRPRLVR